MSVGSATSCPLDAYTSQYASQLAQVSSPTIQTSPDGSIATVPPVNPAPNHGPTVNSLGQHIGGLISTTA